MDFNESIESIKKELHIISDFKEKFEMTVNERSENGDPLLFIGVVKTDNLGDVIDAIEAKFGEPYKRGGDPAYYANLNDRFIKDIGGVRTDQILYCKEVFDATNLYCAVWPWTSKPEFTSVRFGLISYSTKVQEDLMKNLSEEFNNYKK